MIVLTCQKKKKSRERREVLLGNESLFIVAERQLGVFWMKFWCLTTIDSSASTALAAGTNRKENC